MQKVAKGLHEQHVMWPEHEMRSALCRVKKQLLSIFVLSEFKVKPAAHLASFSGMQETAVTVCVFSLVYNLL